MSALLSLVLAASNPFLAEALEHERNLDFEKCVQRLKQASTQWKSSTGELRDIELHLGLCQFNLGDKAGATEHFRVALRIDESTELPPYTSPKAVELFLAAKKSLQPAPPPMPDEDLPDDRPLKDPPKKNLSLSQQVTAPSPIGSFLTRRAAPLSLGVVTLASAITGIALGLRAQDLATQANASRFEADFFALGAQARGFATGATISWIVAAASAIGAVITWWVTGEPLPSPVE
jgi:hypothetical protein